jgi:hypothetical protein
MGIVSEYVEKIKELQANKEEANKYKEGIIFLNDSAKLKEMVNLVVNNNSLRNEIDASARSIREYIDRKNARILALQRKLERPKSIKGLFYSIREKLSREEFERMRAETEANIERYKRKIAKATERLEEIEAIREDVQNPEVVLEECFAEAIEANNQEYAKLVSMSHDSIAKGVFHSSFLNSQIFVKDENGALTIDERKTADFVRLAQEPESIEKLGIFIDAKKDLETNNSKQDRENSRIVRMDAFIHNSKSRRMSRINDEVNAIIRKHNELMKIDNPESESIWSRIARRIMENPLRRIPKKVLAKRAELASMINDFIYSVETDETKKAMFNSYAEACQAESDDSIIGIEELKSFAASLQYRDIVEYDYQEENTIDSLLPYVKSKQRESLEKLATLKTEAQGLSTRYNELAEGLRRREIRILNNFGEEGVECAKYFLDKTSQTGSRKAEKAVAGLDILKGLASTADIDIAETMEAFKEVYGEDTANGEIERMNSEVYKVIHTIKGRLKELSEFTKPKEKPAHAVDANTVASRKRPALER